MLDGGIKPKNSMMHCMTGFSAVDSMHPWKGVSMQVNSLQQQAV
jgi:hypothetical protein